MRLGFTDGGVLAARHWSWPSPSPHPRSGVAPCAAPQTVPCRSATVSQRRKSCWKSWRPWRSRSGGHGPTRRSTGGSRRSGACSASALRRHSPTARRLYIAASQPLTRLRCVCRYRVSTPVQLREADEVAAARGTGSPAPGARGSTSKVGHHAGRCGQRRTCRAHSGSRGHYR